MNDGGSISLNIGPDCDSDALKDDELRLSRPCGFFRVACLLATSLGFYSPIGATQEPSDFVGYWHGRYTGNGANVAVHFDRWLEDGKLKGMMTMVPFFVAYEEIEINSDGTLQSETPSTLGVLEGTVAISLPKESGQPKTSRVAWAQSEGNMSGAGDFTWDEPDLTNTPTDSELTGQYQGALWPGLAATESLDVSMDIRVREDVVTGKVELPTEEVEITKGHRFGNRIVFEVVGDAIRGLWAGSVTPQGLRFHWDMGVGYGQAEFKKKDLGSDGGE